MEAITESQYFIRWTGPFSPWWLLVALPVLLLLSWYLYKIQFKGLSRGTKTALMAMRWIILGAVCVLIFRPNLVNQLVTTYPGRIVVAVDDSESMLAADNRLSDKEALQLARQVSGNPGPDAAYFRAAQKIRDALVKLRKFERFSAGVENRDDAYWKRSDTMQKSIAGLLKEAKENISESSSPPEKIVKKMENLYGDLSTLFRGKKFAGASVFDSFYSSAEKLLSKLATAQAEVDQKRMEKENNELKGRVATMQKTPRLERLRTVLEDVPETVEEIAPDQGVTFVRLMDDSEDIESTRAPDLEEMETQKGQTDIIDSLRKVINKDTDFPLSGVLLFSDGRHLGGGPVEETVTAYSQRNVPIHCAAMGDDEEPTDVSMLEIVAPPFGVQEREMRVEVRLKTSLPSPQDLKLTVQRGDKVVTSKTVTLGKKKNERVKLSFTPARKGVARYVVKVSSADGELFPVRNNNMDFTTNIRENKVRVLLMDWGPRWETRFALNIFKRLDYIFLNSIISVVEEEGEVNFGVGKGKWPEDLDQLKMYDLVVLGERSVDILGAEKMKQLGKYVSDGGGTVAVIGSGLYDAEVRSRFGPEDLREKLLPVRSEDEAVSGEVIDWRSPDALKLSRAGRLHPVTRKLGGQLKGSHKSPESFLAPQSLSLMQMTANGAPIMATRLVGEGKVLAISNPRLWKNLNPTMLAAHANVYMGMIQWAVEGGSGTKPETPFIVLDQRQIKQREGMQVWVHNLADNVEVEAVDGEKVVAKAKTKTWPTKDTLQRAVFENIPPGKITFRIKEQPQITTPGVYVTERNMELAHLAQDTDFLQSLAKQSGGERRPAVEYPQLLSQIEPKKRVETDETTWQLWDYPLIMALVGLLMTTEWVWRKFVGLV